MEKLSSILPKSARTQSADHSKSQPARPGAPLLGRPMGKVTNKTVFESTEAETLTRPQLDVSFADKFSMTIPEDKVTLSDDSGPEAKLAGYTRKGELQKVKIAEEVSRKFAKIDMPNEVEGKSLSEEAVVNSIDTTELMPS